MSPAVVLGIVVLALYWAWIGYFFARVRPRIMNALGRRLRVDVAESTDVLDAGTYGVQGDDAPLRKTGAVLVADLVVLFLGTVGAAALLFIPAFLVADSGALLPLEGRLTGRSATLRVAGGAAMPHASGKATMDVHAENVGHESLRECVAGVDGYTARNGYLHGNSPRFELAPGQRRTLSMALDATRPSAGEHRFRLKLECAGERLAVADAVVAVR